MLHPKEKKAGKGGKEEGKKTGRERGPGGLRPTTSRHVVWTPVGARALERKLLALLTPMPQEAAMYCAVVSW